MSRILAVLLVGIGLALVGVALGLLYLDQRDAMALRIAMEAGAVEAAPQGDSLRPNGPTAGSPQDKTAKAIQAWHEESRVWAALVSGSLGAGMFGAGCLLTLIHVATMWRDRTGHSPPPVR